MNGAHGLRGDPAEQIIALIGYRGCGKTAIGRRLAKRLGWKFIDTDGRIQRETGRSIRELFETEGERGFRRIEAEVLEKVLTGRQLVISVGGGAVLARRNRKALRAAGTCVWLTAPPELLLQRIAGDEHSEEQRPALTSQPPLEEIREVLQARLPVYEATADHVVNTTDRTFDEVVESILRQLGFEDPNAKGS